MKIVVVSDSHRHPDVLEKIVTLTQADYFLHAGDSGVPEALLRPYLSVKGNCDFYAYPLERIVEAGDVRIYLHHGHVYSLSKMIEKAKQLNCHIVIYGHTHVPKWDQINGMHVINPGSVAFPRRGSQKSYAVITFDSPATIHCTFIHL
ncbi:MAG: metallophosphoesterase [Bacilli bacterium]